MVLVAVHLHAPRYLLQLAVDTDGEEALAAHLLEQLAIVALTAAHQRGQDEDAPSGIVVPNHVDDLLLGILHHGLAGHIAVGTTGTGKEQTQVVVNLSGGANGGTGILVGGLLLNADDGRQTRYLVDIGTLQAAQEVAGVGREGLNVPALALGKDGVEGQA